MKLEPETRTLSGGHHEAPVEELGPLVKSLKAMPKHNRATTPAVVLDHHPRGIGLVVKLDRNPARARVPRDVRERLLNRAIDRELDWRRQPAFLPRDPQVHLVMRKACHELLDQRREARAGPLFTKHRHAGPKLAQAFLHCLASEPKRSHDLVGRRPEFVPHAF